MKTGNATCAEYFHTVGLVCSLHARYVECLLQDCALLIERSVEGSNRNRELSQQRDPRMRKRSLDEIGRVWPFFDKGLRPGVSIFTGIRDKYAHAFVSIDAGEVVILHPPHMKHAEAGLIVSADVAIKELNQAIADFSIVAHCIDLMREELGKEIYRS